jgi:hypothetical protein
LCPIRAIGGFYLLPAGQMKISLRIEVAFLWLNLRILRKKIFLDASYWHLPIISLHHALQKVCP